MRKMRTRIIVWSRRMAWCCFSAAVLIAITWTVVGARVVVVPTIPPITSPATELVLVHAISRHGERTPADTFPTDPNINSTLYPYGWGSLTNEGRRHMFSIGQYLRSRYDKFLGELYTEKSTYAQSTGANRARMSCALILAGLWPPAGSPLDWNPVLNWQPIPIVAQELDDDTLLLVRKPCPRFDEALNEVLKGEYAVGVLRENSALLKELSEKSGKIVTNFDDVQDIYSTLRAEEETGLELAEWTKDYYPEKLLPLTSESFIINTFTDELIRLKAGVFLEKLFYDWKTVAAHDRTVPARLSVYTGHDATVANLGRALGVWEPQVPDYGITFLLELHRKIDLDEYFVKVFLLNSTRAEPFELTIPGCKENCPLKDVISLRSHLIPENWDEECQARDSNYISPPLRGP